MDTPKGHFAGTYQIRILLGTLLAAVIADGVITEFLILNGFGAEGNPFLHFWVGKDVFLIIKSLLGLLAVLYLWKLYKRHPKLSISVSSLWLTAP